MCLILKVWQYMHMTTWKNIWWWSNGDWAQTDKCLQTQDSTKYLPLFIWKLENVKHPHFYSIRTHICLHTTLKPLAQAPIALQLTTWQLPWLGMHHVQYRNMLSPEDIHVLAMEQANTILCEKRLQENRILCQICLKSYQIRYIFLTMIPMGVCRCSPAGLGYS